MYSLAVTALEETARLSRAASQRETIGDECVRDEDEIDLLRASSQDDSTLADAHRGYFAAASMNQKLFDFAARCSMRNITIGKIRDRESLTGCDSTFLSMSPALRPMKESA